MAALLDVNVLLALVTSKHTHSSIAAKWFEQISPTEAVVCRVAQLGLLRLLNNSTLFPQLSLSGADCWKSWHVLASDTRIHFEPNEPEGIDAEFRRICSTHSMTAKRWTDAYLAAFAAASGLRVATFDRGFREFSGVEVELIG